MVLSALIITCICIIEEKMSILNQYYDKLYYLRKKDTFDVSASTRAQYDRVVRHFVASEFTDIREYLKSVTPRSFYKTRSALLWKLLYRAKTKLDSVSKTQADVESVCHEVDAAFNLCVELLEIVPPPKAMTKTGNSSRKKIPMVKGQDWREVMLNSASKISKPFVAAIMMTGCRPAEIENGLTMRVSDNGEEKTLTILIKGAKVTSLNGQPLRKMTFSYNTDHPAIKELIYFYEKNKNSKGVATLQRSAGTVSQYVRDARAVAGFRGRRAPTAYSFRHQFSADCKMLGVDEVSLAKMMGHRSTKTQSVYGSPRQGNIGGITPIQNIASFAASEEVRDYGSRKTINFDIDRSDPPMPDPF